MNYNSHLLLSYSLSISFDILALLATDMSGGFLSLFFFKQWKYFPSIVFLQHHPSHQHFAAINELSF